MLRLLYSMITEKNECEKVILAAIINKLVSSYVTRVFIRFSDYYQGDKDKTVASKGVFSLINLVKKHPGMRLYITKEIESFVFRPNILPSAQWVFWLVVDTVVDGCRYHAIILLNQFVMSVGDGQLAEKMIEVYFKMFESMNERQRVNFSFSWFIRWFPKLFIKNIDEKRRVNWEGKNYCRKEREKPEKRKIKERHRRRSPTFWPKMWVYF